MNTNETRPTEKDVTRDLAVEVCARSGDHAAGRGRHNAYRWGPCSDHERIVAETVATLAQMGVVIPATEE